MTEHEIDQAVGKALRKLRKSKGLSQEALGYKVGITFQQIQKYEKASNRIAVSKLISLSIALEISPSHFFKELSVEGITKYSAFDWVI